jgi:TolB protein
MKKTIIAFLAIGFAAVTVNSGRAEEERTITKTQDVLGQTRPKLVAMSGFTGEAAEVLKFDLYVQGFCFTNADAAQYLISGSDSGDVTGTLTDIIGRNVLFSHSYNGANTRRQAHAFADDIVEAVQKWKGIGQSKIAYCHQATGFGPGEIFMADFDGHGARAITSDNAIVGKSAWVPGRMAIYYTSFVRNNPDIYFINLANGQRRLLAGYTGLNSSASVSPDGAKVAMVLSKDGSPNIWVCNADGTGLKRITSGIEDSSPCWSPDGQWICFAMKTREQERRHLAKVSPNGGEVHQLRTDGAPNPSEPDWSPDGKWIAFTSQAGGFNVCVMPADGSAPPAVLVSGQNPSWAPNSRTLIYNHGPDSRSALSVLDVFTKQYKDCARATGSNSQPAWAK